MKEISTRLINKYGEEKELLKILEEMNELSQEIYRDINHDEVNRTAILEERIDVELMLNLLDEIYNFGEETKAKMWEKKKKKIESKYL